MTALAAFLALLSASPDPAPIGSSWPRAEPADVGLDDRALAALAAAIGGDGCVVRHGRLAYTWGRADHRADVASACKPVLVHLLLAAVADGRLRGLDERAAAFEPRLARLNPDLAHKDAAITFEQLARQVSGYGVSDPPGAAFDYNDWQMALFADLLVERVYRSSWDRVDREVLRPLLTDRLGCEDGPTLVAFGVGDRPGRLAISPRDFARFGQLYLEGGRRGEDRLLPESLVRKALASPLPGPFPRTTAKPAAMLDGQRTLGSRRVPDDQTDHLGSYSFTWWTNGLDRDGRRHWPGAPIDTVAALGHGGKRALVVIPSLDLVASWNDTRVDGRDTQDAALAALRTAVQP